MGNKTSKSERSNSVGVRAQFDKRKDTVTANIIVNSESQRQCDPKLYYFYMPSLDIKYCFSRAKCLLCFGHKYEMEGQYQLALNAFVEAVDVLHFISTFCLKKGNANINNVRKQTVIAIRRVMLLQSRILSIVVKDDLKVRLPIKVDFDRPTPEEALEYLLKNLPKDEREVIQNIHQMCRMEVPEVQWSDIVGAESAKIALNDAIAHRLNYQQEICYNILCFYF